ncbi:MAG: hypothetical protein ABI123_05250 [Ginsengibacter sp.]
MGHAISSWQLLPIIFINLNDGEPSDYPYFLFYRAFLFADSGNIFGLYTIYIRYNSHSDADDDKNKVLCQNMLDMQIYHDNLGTWLCNGDADNASWLLRGWIVVCR